jgi:ATP-dependent 26S proteasome regulatory subunit
VKAVEIKLRLPVPLQLDANFLKVVSSAIVDKYIGESARLIREMFNYARDHQVPILNFAP